MKKENRGWFLKIELGKNVSIFEKRIVKFCLRLEVIGSC